MHAYDDEPGPLDVPPLCAAGRDRGRDPRLRGSGIEAIPAADDRLQGRRPPPSSVPLTQSSEFQLGGRREGTEGRMVFAGRARGQAPVPQAGRVPRPRSSGAPTSSRATRSCRFPPVSAFVGGVPRAPGQGPWPAKARFSLDRFSGTSTSVTDAIAAHAARAAPRRTGSRSALSTEVRRLELTIGPFRDGTGSWAERERRLTGRGWRLVDAQAMRSDVRAGGRDGEMLHVVMVDHRPVGRSLSG